MTTTVCKKCNKAIYGSYVRATGAYWHPEHFVCTHCHRPLGNSPIYEQQGMPYDAACYLELFGKRCAYCGKPLNSWMHDQWGTIFCEEHQRQFPHCAYCGRLVSPQQQKTSMKGHENVRCPVCQSTAIETVADAEPIFSRLKQWIGSQGLRYNNLPIKLELCNRAKLAQYLGGQTESHSLGATMHVKYMQNGQHIRTEVSGVAVLAGLPSTLFQGVTIHELGHVWLTTHGIEHLQPWQEEGFCELLAYRYYMHVNTTESLYHAQCIEKNPNRVYGDGFRRVRAIAARVGFERLLEVLRTTKRMPN